MLVGGFPRQDYPVARPLPNSNGIEGKKGILWWQIRDILIAKKPPFVLLENVDRLLKSPASQRGRDFGVILSCFANMRVLLGAVEMYNMDNAVMMDKLDIDKLVQGGYLKSSPAKPEAECSYNGYGLTENGEIYCTYHGSIEHPRNMD